VDDDLVKFYNKELNYIRRSAAAFSEANPKIAARLRLSKDTIEDPHVSRLIESVAYLNARTRRKLDDSFPELSNSMLEVLYPHYLAPIPSMSIVQFKSVPDITKQYNIKRGSNIETEAIEGEPCRFQTAYPVELWPIDVSQAQLIRGSYNAPKVSKHIGAVAVIKIKLRCLSDDLQFSELSPEQLVFYINGQSTETSAIYELLMNHTVAIGVADQADDPNVTFIDAKNLQPVGFDSEEGLLPYPARSLMAYRLLTEFFVFPEKYNFIQLGNLGKHVFAGKKQEVELYIYLNESFPELENTLSEENFQLGCTPIVNLFKQQSEAISLDHTKTEYHVIADSRRRLAKEIYSIDKVVATAPDGENIEYRPFYGFNHMQNSRNNVAYWHATRKTAQTTSQDEIDNGSELYISLVDIDFQEDIPNNWILNISTTCLNRDLPNRLPFGGGQPKLQLGEGNAPLSLIHCITAPSRTRRLSLTDNTRWRLISHLNLNHLSLLDSEHGADVLREILTLYNFDNSASTRAMIDGVFSISHKQVMARVRDKGNSALCRGIEITLTLDDDRFESRIMFLFASVLERFFALYAPMNSFTKLVLKSKRQDRVIKTWAPRSGEKIIL